MNVLSIDPSLFVQCGSSFALLSCMWFTVGFTQVDVPGIQGIEACTLWMDGAIPRGQQSPWVELSSSALHFMSSVVAAQYEDGNVRRKLKGQPEAQERCEESDERASESDGQGEAIDGRESECSEDGRDDEECEGEGEIDKS